jgi:quercetin dioxygenase-like cupin family protein
MADARKRHGILAACTATPKDLNALIDYAADSVVSKTLVDKDPGTVTLFAFDAGQRLSEHTAPFDALVQITDGRAVVTIAGQEMTVAAGQVVIMPANIPHAVGGEERFKMLLTMIRA